MVLIVAIFPLVNPLIRCPITKSNAPGTASVILINSLVDSDTLNSTGVNLSPINEDSLSPILNFYIFWLTLNNR